MEPTFRVEPVGPRRQGRITGDYAEKTQCQYENDASRDNHVLLGKILRINPNGTIPADNPYAGRANSARCSPVGPATPGEIARTEAGDFC
jgi:demethoxyubiquinone hydroxylase (CLK1/Coq7/Cat5 family)